MSNAYDAGSARATTDQTITTTTELVISNISLTMLSRTRRVVQISWAQITTGIGTTALTHRARRGTTITDPLVGEANAEQVKAVAGSTEPIFLMLMEEQTNLRTMVLSHTIQQTGATGNGIVLQSGRLQIQLP